MPAEPSPRPRSFLRNLFAGDVEESLLFPFPEISADEKDTISTFLDSLRQFAAARIDPRKIEREHRVADEVVAGLAELGILGLTIPEAYGGYGFSAAAYCRVMQEVAAIDASLAILVGGHQSIGLKALLLFGTEEQKAKWLPDLAAGKSIAAFALTEPEAGSDAAAQRTTAVYDSSTKEFVLNGTKQWISNGGFATFFTVFARDEALPESEPHRRITAFAVTSDRPGLVRGKEENKLGLKGSSTCQIQFDNLRVAGNCVLGERGKGFKVAVEVLNTGRTSLAAGCLGACHAMIREAVAHATRRKQFNSPISEFEMIREKIARMVADTYALESMVYLTAGFIDSGIEDYSIEGACCKVFGTETAWRVINDALQIAGGNGFMEEYPYEKALRDSRINMIFEGTNEILRLLIALSGMKDVGEYMKGVGKAIRAPLTGLGLLWEYEGKRLRRVVAPKSLARVAPELAAEGEQIARYVGALGNAVEKLLQRHGRAILDREYHQERIANVTIELYAGLASLSRATASIAARGAGTCADEILAVREFLRESRHRIVGNIKALDRNGDAQQTAISERAYASAGYAFPYWP